MIFICHSCRFHTGYHRWSERYDRELKDILVQQDDIVKNILMAMRTMLIEGEQLWYWQGGTPPEKLDLKLVETSAKMKWHFGQNTLEGIQTSRQHI